ncbi:glutamate synthase large subunit [Mycetocola saprophilus]|uniref:glutamate synthase large subunit n=1 Tax=Mycetocola saprophilus TaxID=76636 RepID=UPI0004BF9F80|nr:glutamate synthase large subunit [Mycetocola saprophilus]
MTQHSPYQSFSAVPPRQGLYNPVQEKDACGLAAVATLRGTAGHDIIELALQALRNLEHRGAIGSDAGTGDGAGLLSQVPDAFLREVTSFELPEAGEYAVGMAFLPQDAAERAAQKAAIEQIAAEEELTVLGWREVPTDPEHLGTLAREAMPAFEQLFVRVETEIAHHAPEPQLHEHSPIEPGAPEEVITPHATLFSNLDAVSTATSSIPTIATPSSSASIPTPARSEDIPPAVPTTAARPARPDPLLLDRLAYRLRRRAEHELGAYFASLSSRTLVYKGMVTTLQLEPFYPDLSDARFASKLALVHSRYSTNTFPSWPLAQPLRMLAHNGEINTVEGNRNWMRARQSQLASDLLGDLSPLLPICTPGASDSASLDEVFELLTLSGRSITHAMTMLVPEAWEKKAGLDDNLRAFYEFSALQMEPWDGPAALTFTDGTQVGATLDRNGLRPGRWLETTDGLVVLGSEIGILPIAPERVARKGRLRPGQMFVVDTAEGRIIEDTEVKKGLAESEPWAKWLETEQITLEDLPEREHIVHTAASITRRQRTFGYTEEEVRILLAPMGQNGAEPLGAMGSDTPIAVLSDRPRLVFDYFTQRFAQVTNPPLDAIREERVTSLSIGLGPEHNLLEDAPAHARRVILKFPVINNDELAKIQHIEPEDLSSAPAELAVTIRGLYRFDRGENALRDRLDEIRAEVDTALARGAEFLVLSDRESTKDLAPIPSLLLLSTVHHHLVERENRMRVGLIVEAGDVREVHHVALLIGYGATAVNPYLAMETCEHLTRTGVITGITPEQAVKNVIYALGKGVLKIMSKMGISTVSSYAGAQAFEAVGLSQELIDGYFGGTVSTLGGVDLGVLAAETMSRHKSAYPDNSAERVHERLNTGGEYQWRRDGAPHLFNPETVFKLQHATRSRRYDIFREYTALVDEQNEKLMTLRGLFRLEGHGRTPVPLDEVESVADIVKRFSTGAMSYGSISKEAHETLAIAMNRLGAKSNTGEGGEDTERLLDPERRSSIKQVASGRFGVTSMYLTHADDIQIKLAQGAKPGEGGQLPPTKVYPWVARTRHATPGVGLISPPPHHDIYSIEDLKQLIFDLKRANPAARIHTKLVSQAGIGAVAAGVAKALSDVILVSGHDGGTGASPMNSLKHAGTPWELGLAETQQTLILNNMRDRVVVQVDGQLKTGRDVIIGALLGAEEFGFATAPLVVSGCIMMRVCHLDTCPVGVATQNPVLRERFTGKPEFVVNFFEFIAEEVREYLAALGFRTLDEAIGRVDLIHAGDAAAHWKARGLDLDPLLYRPETEQALRGIRTQDHELDEHFDNQLIAHARAALENGEPVAIDLPINNTDRAVGTMLGHEVTKRHGEAGLPESTIEVALHGTAGQSLGAFMPAGIALRLEGEANDYVGKGLSGGLITLRPPREATYQAEESVIAGNVIGYGATSGQIFLRGVVGERFLVRNSGATAVAEGVGDHALEYMTGGEALILGPTGHNVGAGMSGGVAYIYRLNPEAVNPDARESGELGVHPLDRADQERLRELLGRHFEATGSPVAEAILADFESASTEFSKLVPRDFAAVQATRAQAETEGLDLDGDVVWERILEVTRG